MTKTKGDAPAEIAAADAATSDQIDMNVPAALAQEAAADAPAADGAAS